MLLSGAEKTLSIISEHLKWKLSLPDANVLKLSFQIRESILQQMALEMSAKLFVQELLYWRLISFMTINIVILFFCKIFGGDFSGQVIVNMRGR